MDGDYGMIGKPCTVMLPNSEHDRPVSGVIANVGHFEKQKFYQIRYWSWCLPFWAWVNAKDVLVSSD